jgi:hypothetical protein
MPRMSMVTREPDQSPLWIAPSDCRASPGHPFYARLNAIVDAHGFDRFAEDFLRGHTNILKRLLIHAGAFNRVIMRQLIGLGAPRVCTAAW